MKPLFVIAFSLVLLGLIRFIPAYQIDKDFALSRVLAGFDARFTAYHRFFLSVESGMSRDEIEQLLKDHYPAGGKRQAPTRVTEDANELFLFMNPEHSKEPNCEGISIRFADGKVVGKSYSMD